MTDVIEDTQSTARQFDLNIEKVLEHWTIAHAMREIIANALDEQALTGTADPEITQDGTGDWHIRDFGRGLRYEHLTQKENTEKLKHPGKIIGKFGVGLKDALATADRREVAIRIHSRHGDVTISKASKHGFNDVVTLHANIHAANNVQLVGTDFVLSGVYEEDVSQAKGFFRRYSGDEVLEDTKYGCVLRKSGKLARIYVNGLCVAEEEKFLFSYDITSLTTALRKALNRERTNVGRTAYQDRVKSILLECTASAVTGALANDLRNFETGTIHDEPQWIDVALHACRILNANEKVIFVTSVQLRTGTSLIGHAESDGYRVIVVPQNIADKLPKLKDIHGEPVRSLERYGEEWHDSFEFSFIDPDKLTAKEKAVYDMTSPILQLAGKKRTQAIKQVLISEKMRLDEDGAGEVQGLWQFDEHRVIIKRSQLCSLEDYSAVLLHEVTHAFTDASDLEDEFEDGLTEMLGVLANLALKDRT